MIWEIYKIVLDKDEAVYYGQHLLYKFYKGNESIYGIDSDYLGSGLILNRYYSKYGTGIAHKQVLCYAYSQDEANRFEKCVIRLSRLNGENILNISDGGAGGSSKGWKHSEETRKLISSKVKGKNAIKNKLLKPILGKIRVNNGSVERYVFPNNIPEGFVKGSLPEYKKIRECLGGKKLAGRVHVNNGSVSLFVYPQDVPVGFVLGRLSFSCDTGEKIRKKLEGRIRVNNGFIELLVPRDDIPTGFSRGLLPDHKVKLRLGANRRCMKGLGRSSDGRFISKAYSISEKG